MYIKKNYLIAFKYRLKEINIELPTLILTNFF